MGADPKLEAPMRSFAAATLIVIALTAAETASAAPASTGKASKTSVKTEVWSNRGCGGATIKRVPNKRKKYRIKPSPTADNDSDIDARTLDELRKKLDCLRRIHEMQTKLVRNGGKMSEQQRKRLREKIRQQQKFLGSDIAGTADFPFATRMSEIDRVVSEISGGRSPEYREWSGQSREKILEAIHSRQIQALTRKIKSAK